MADEFWAKFKKKTVEIDTKVHSFTLSNSEKYKVL